MAPAGGRYLGLFNLHLAAPCTAAGWGLVSVSLKHYMGLYGGMEDSSGGRGGGVSPSWPSILQQLQGVGGRASQPTPPLWAQGPSPERTAVPPPHPRSPWHAPWFRAHKASLTEDPGAGASSSGTSKSSRISACGRGGGLESAGQGCPPGGQRRRQQGAPRCASPRTWERPRPWMLAQVQEQLASGQLKQLLTC